MSRNTPRRRRPAAAVALPAAAKGMSGVTEPIEDRWHRTLGLTRAMLGASLGTSQAWMRGWGDWQQAQAIVLRHAGERIDQIASQAERASDWPALWAVQASLAGTQWTRTMQDCTELIDQAMQIEARLVERSRTDAARLSQHWRGNFDGGEDRDVADTVEASAPLAMLGQAQTLMTEMSRLWTQAVYNTSLPD
ncbi:MAG: hypothetical protein Q8L49_05555 [Burkholderiaceae bacterium]|nr:hypothetical protein [Burkholderiaceae bacterium]